MTVVSVQVPDYCDIEKLSLHVPLDSIGIQHDGQPLGLVIGYETVDVDDSED